MKKTLIALAAASTVTAANAQHIPWTFSGWDDAIVQSAAGQNFDVHGNGSLIINTKVTSLNAAGTRPTSTGGATIATIATAGAAGDSLGLSFSAVTGTMVSLDVTDTTQSADETIVFGGLGAWSQTSGPVATFNGGNSFTGTWSGATPGNSVYASGTDGTAFTIAYDYTGIRVGGLAFESESVAVPEPSTALLGGLAGLGLLVRRKRA